MRYFSTNRRSTHTTFDDAVLAGQPDDGGLFFPEEIVKHSDKFLDHFPSMANEKLAFEIIRPYVGKTISDDDLEEITAETVNFKFPLVEINKKISSLELFHGPTLAFKDVGARFMSRCLRYFMQMRSLKALVIVATSGDTGGAVANGFHNVEGVDVVILYPKGRVSRVQEQQLTTLGGNITTLEVRGSFDDCQAMAKRALADDVLKKRIFLTSANSINVARWLPQQFYYYFAAAKTGGKLPVVSVPSGNFGNICAGMFANAAGLKAEKFIAACNANDVIPQYLSTGNLVKKDSVATISNAMDVALPSNFVRINEIFDGDIAKIRKKLIAVSIDDKTTVETMRRVYDEYGYVLDPHGAVGYRALADYLSAEPDLKGIFLETAHPVKFDVVEEILGSYGEIPDSVKDLGELQKQTVEIDNDYSQLTDVILSKV